MGQYLNSRVPFEGYKEIAGTRFFVDKSLIIEDILSALKIDGQKYLCITIRKRCDILICKVFEKQFYLDGRGMRDGINQT